MFIIWGTKIVRKNLGRTADFCLFCRDFQPHKVVEVESVGHLYYIPLGTRKGLGIENTCTSCGLYRMTMYEQGYPITSTDRHADTESLLAETNPDARRNWAPRLSVEERMRANQLTSDERISALYESFLLANSFVDRRTAEMRFDSVSSLGCIGTIALAGGAYFVADSVLKSDSQTGLIAGAILGGLMAVITLVLISRDGRRYTRKTVLPMLIRAIRPIRPKDEEIETVLEIMRSRNEKLGTILTTQQVVEALMFAAD